VAVWVWLRSPYYNNNNNFCEINNNGNYNNNNASWSAAVAPGFCYARSNGVAGRDLSRPGERRPKQKEIYCPGYPIPKTAL